MGTNPTADKQTVVVAGDIVIDHHLYEGQRMAPTQTSKAGVLDIPELGGAYAVHHLLEAIIEYAKSAAKRQDDAAKLAYEAAVAKGETLNPPQTKVPLEANAEIHLGVIPPKKDNAAVGDRAYAVWKPYLDEDGSKKSYWRASLVMGYGSDEITPNRNSGPEVVATTRIHTRAEDIPPANILVLDDAGFLFRHTAASHSWPVCNEIPDWILLKMASPIAQGDLWTDVINKHADRLICVVSANDLRRECVSLNQGLSWERTIGDFKTELHSNPTLNGLKKCRHLIVVFSSDGALWLDQPPKGNVNAVFVGDMAGAEGAFDGRLGGRVFGHSTCMVSAVTHGLILHGARSRTGGSATRKLDLSSNIAAGLNAMRDLATKGHGIVGEAEPKGFPLDRLAKVICDNAGPITWVSIPWENCNEHSWMIVESSQRPATSKARPSVLGLARQVVLVGPDAIKSLPHASFGKMVTTDRFEIEALRHIGKLMLDYKGSHSSKPLSIGVFGPPGAGKSFGVNQLANGVFSDKAWLEFNLSQFRDPNDLIGAFHQVRDKVLGGTTPVVFWDEFDSQEYKWLQYLLAPMQDGRFQEGQLNHAIGKCVFVFAGATSRSYATFGPQKDDGSNALRDYKLCKGPDFVSRLDAYYDVLGPNPRMLPSDKPGGKPEPDPDDVSWSLRRAILIRARFQCPSDMRMDFDPDLLDALIRVPLYIHGARSVEKVISALQPADGRTVRRSSVPAPSDLDMHADSAKFAHILNRNNGFRQAEVIEPLAPAIHETWRRLSREQGWRMQPHLDKPYDELLEVDKDENRAAARRIPDVLALAGLGIARDEKSEGNAHGVAEHIELHIERLTEAEHDGWMDHRKQNGWRYAPVRDDEKKEHPALVSYDKLSAVDKRKDRDSVVHFPTMVNLAEETHKSGKPVKYRIVFLEMA